MVSSVLIVMVLDLAALALAAGGEPRVLRERQQRVCGSAHFGSSSGASPQRLVVTHLTPGVADWNIAVPMPPMCKNARVTGVETSVCDADEPPDVSMHDLVSARVHRPGQLASYATVDVTVYCVLPPSTPAPPATPAAPPAAPLGAYGAASAPGLQYGDTRSSYEVLSNELISNEVVSGEVASSEVSSDGLTSNELVLKVVTPIPSVMTPPSVETSTPHIQLTSLVQSVDPPAPKESLQSNDLQSKSYEVTIKITPPSYEPTEKGKIYTYEARLPMLPVKDEARIEKDDPISEIQTPSRNSPILTEPPAVLGSTSGAIGSQPGPAQTETYLPLPESRGPPRGPPEPQPGRHLPPPGMHAPPPEIHGPPPGMHASRPGMHAPPPQSQAPYPGSLSPQSQAPYPGSLSPQSQAPYPGSLSPQSQASYPGSLSSQSQAPYPGSLSPQSQASYPGSLSSQSQAPYPGSLSSLYDTVPPALLVAPLLRPLRWLRPRFRFWPRQRSVLLFSHL